MKRVSILMVLAGLLIGSCSKDNSKPDNSSNGSSGKSKKELITNSWQLVSIIDNTAGAGSPDLLQDCRKDDTWTFLADGTDQIDAGTVYCDPNDPEYESAAGVWNIDHYPLLIIKDNTNITPHPDTIVIDVLDETTLKYTQEIDNDGNTYTTTWKRK